MPSIQTAYQYCINACNSPTVGYDNDLRNKQTVNGITYYDCSSLIWFSLMAGGFDVVGANGGNTWPFVTWTMPTALTRLGFVQVPLSGLWKAGDIALSATHTEMVYKGDVGRGICMGAHRKGVPLANQVSIGSSDGNAEYYSPASRWETLWRYGDGADGEITSFQWIYGEENEYFGSGETPIDQGTPDSRMLNNACCVLQYFLPRGWTVQAISALCANMQQESTLNPCLIEIGGTGHGLVQWTPPSNLYDVLDVLYNRHDDWHDGDKQCSVIWAEFEQSTGQHDWGIEGQWYSTSAYPMDWLTWSQSTDDPGYLALAFQANYERPASLHPERAITARAWYNYLITIDIYSPNRNKFRGIPIWMMIHYNENFKK